MIDSDLVIVVHDRRVFGCSWIVRLHITPLRRWQYRTWRIGRGGGNAYAPHIDVGWNPHGYGTGSVLLAWIDAKRWRVAVARRSDDRRLYAFVQVHSGRRYQVGGDK